MNRSGTVQGLEWVHSLLQELENEGVELPMGDYGVAYKAVEDAREFLSSTDLTWGNCVSYSPVAVRTEAFELLNGSPTNYWVAEHSEVLKWAAGASDEELAPVADYALQDDAIWDGYVDSVIDALVTVYGQRQKISE